MCLQARYNAWMNAQLYAVCAGMTEAERKRDLGAFFGSIHGTFNHLLLVDRLWLARLRGEVFGFVSLCDELYADFDVLRAERERTDAALTSFVAGLDAAGLAREIDYRSAVDGRHRRVPVGRILIHVFHHQTHHRGQITTLIGQLGHDFGETDVLFMPDAVDPPS